MRKWADSQTIDWLNQKEIIRTLKEKKRKGFSKGVLQNISSRSSIALLVWPILVPNASNWAASLAITSLWAVNFSNFYSISPITLSLVSRLVNSLETEDNKSLTMLTLSSRQLAPMYHWCRLWLVVTSLLDELFGQQWLEIWLRHPHQKSAS